MIKKRLPLIIIPVLIGIAAASWFLIFKEKKNADTLTVSGNIEVTDIQLGFKISGRLDACFVNEGDTVKKGMLLARLEDVDQKSMVSLAKTGLVRAMSVLSELEAGSRPEEIMLSQAKVLQARQMVLELTRGSRIQEIESARSDLDTAMAAAESAQIQLVQATADYERFSALYKTQSVSQQDHERYQTQYEIARKLVTQASSRVHAARQALSLRSEGPRLEQIEKAKAFLAQAEAENALVTAGPRKEKIEQARALVDEAKERLNQAEQQLSYTELFAPMDGVILSRSSEPGEYLNPSTPVVTMGDLANPWLRAYVSETDLGRLRLKDTVKVTTDSFPEKSYDGILTFISSQAEFTPKSVQTFEERVKLMFRIKIGLSNPNGELKPGMPADAAILTPES